eukprot:3720265-Amphidinium_carterae.1
MTSLAGTGYSTPMASEDRTLEQAPEPTEAADGFEGGRTVSGNITCECCGEKGLWSEFAFAEIDDQMNWEAAKIHNQKLWEAVSLVKKEKGGKVTAPAEEQFNNGK